MRKRCIGMNKSGERCGLKPCHGKKYCHHHTPPESLSDVPNEHVREELSTLENDREDFMGFFERVGSKPGGGTTVLLKNISRTSSPEILSDHSWFNLTKGFHDLGHMKQGEPIIFTARVKRYEKGTKDNRTFDYKFSLPLGVRRP